MGLMGKEIKKKICRDDDFPLLFGDDFLIHVLIRLPIVSLLRFKSVCKFWCTLIETSFFTHLHHTFNPSSSSASSNFGTFILQALVDKYALHPTELHVIKKVETEIIILSSESESGSIFSSGPRSGSSGWCWSTDDDDDFQVSKVYGSKEDDDDDQMLKVYDDDEDDDDDVDVDDDHVFKVDDDDDVDDDHVFKVDDDDNLVLKLDRLGVPSCYKFSFNWRHVKTMVGSCNGLICLYDNEHMEITLWNPATRQFRILPKSITTIENGGGSTTPYLIGFGFDIKTKDYKVVLLDKNVVQVYSLSTDSWRLLEEDGIHSSLPGRPKGHGLYLNGSCFFMAAYSFPTGYNRWCLISFNFTSEIITTMEFPDCHCDHTTKGLFLTYFGGDKMALFTIRIPPKYDNYRNYDCLYDDCDIWVWNEHGCDGGMNKESWTKLHSFQMKTRIGEQIRPRGISNNGEFALLEAIVTGPRGLHKVRLSRKMKLYNLVTKETKKEFLSCSSVMSRAGVYKPSIVSIKGGNGSQA